MRRSWRDMRRERRMARRIELLDTNKDGKVSIAEIHAEQKRLLGAADVNGDGMLSVEEFRRRGRWFISLRTISFFDMLDSDGDGQISEKEMTDPSARWFSRYDANKDKALDSDEFAKSGRRGDRQGRGSGRR
jgi:Ca2+-binding EF-hand superfamily protein